MEDFKIALNKTKIEMMTSSHFSFYTHILLRLDLIVDNKIPTAATDGLKIYFNEEFFLGLRRPERLFLMIHEMEHIIGKHSLRMLGRNPKKWNFATDYYINQILKDLGLDMPKGGLYDSIYKGMSSEEIYDALPDSGDYSEQFDNVMEPSNGDEKGDPTDDSDEQEGNGSGSFMSESELALLEQQIDSIIVSAATETQLANGKVPNHVALAVKALSGSKVNWQTVLKRFIKSKQAGSYSYKKPNMRFYPEIMPSIKHADLIDNLVCVVDTSGSETDYFHQFVGEMLQICRMFKPKKLTVIQFSDGITRIDEVTNYNQAAKLDWETTGGTDFQEVCDWMAENKPKFAVVFTDGEFYTPNRTDSTDYVWILNGYIDRMPWGLSVPYKNE